MVLYANRVELRRSNAAGKHGDKRLKRLRTRTAKHAKAIKDSRAEN